MIRERVFSEMIRVAAQSSELQGKSWSYRPKVGVTAGVTPGLRTESPRKGIRMGLGASAENPLKAFLNPPNVYLDFDVFQGHLAVQ